MGAEDVRRQALNVFRMKMLGATVRSFSFNSKLELYLHPFTPKVVPVESGSKTLKDVVNKAMREWVTNLASTHSLIGSCFGPHPFSTIIRDYQKVVRRYGEIKGRMQEATRKLPHVVVACVTG